MSAPIDHKVFTVAKLNDGKFLISESPSEGPDFDNIGSYSPAKGILFGVVAGGFLWGMIVVAIKHLL